jgi:TolB protein
MPLHAALPLHGRPGATLAAARSRAVPGRDLRRRRHPDARWRWPLPRRGQRRCAVSAIVRADLQRSGLFRSRDAPRRAGRTQHAPPGRLARRGRRRAGGRLGHAPGRRPLRRALQAVGRGKGEQLLGQSKVVLAADLRLAAHRVADEIYQKLTGERGVFATRIAYVTKAGRRYTLHVTDADGEGGRWRWPAPSPSSRRPGRPTAATGLCVLRVAEGGGLGAGPGQWRAPHAGQLPRLQQRAGLVARRPRAGGHAVADGGWRSCTLMGARGRHAAPADQQQRHRHRGRVRARRPQPSTSSATAAAARRSTACRPAAATPSASPSPAATTSARPSAPTAAAGLRRRGRRLPADDAGPGPAAPAPAVTDTSDDESPSFAPNGRLIIYATRSRGATC